MEQKNDRPQENASRYLAQPEADSETGRILKARCELAGANNRVSLVLLLMQMFSVVVAFAFLIAWVIPKIAAGDLTQIGNMTNDTGFLLQMTYISTFFAMIASLIAARGILKQKVFGAIRRPKAGLRFFGVCIVLMLGAGTVGELLADVVNWLFSLFGVNNGMANISFSSDLNTNLITFAYVCLLGPVLEELLFRGMALGSLRRFGDRFAVVVSAVLFGIFHMNLVQAVPAVLMGLVLGYAAVRSGSILPGIVLHILNNTLSMVLSVSLSQDNPVQMGIYIGVMALAVLASAVLVIRNPALFRLADEPQEPLAEKHKYLTFFFRSPAFWVLLLFFVGSCVLLAFGSGDLIQKMY